MNKIYKVEIITRPELFDDLKEALNYLGVNGITHITEVLKEMLT